MPTHGRRQHKDYQEQKQIRRARSQVKRHRTKRVRRKDWLPASTDEDALYDVDSPQSEPVMTRGERERRQAFVDAALSALREDREMDTVLPTDALGKQGTVIEVSSNMCRVELNGQALVCAIRGSLSAEDTGYTNVVAVGDEVIVSESSPGKGIVEAVLPRRSVLA